MSELGMGIGTDCGWCAKRDTCCNSGKGIGICDDFVQRAGDNREMLEKMGLGLGMLCAAMDAGGRCVSVTRSGVVRFPDVAAGFTVNSKDILEAVEQEVIGKRPVLDDNHAFAARVTITVELLGDTEREDGVK